MPNVTIGKYCVIGANAVVTTSFPDSSIIAGNPCQINKYYTMMQKIKKTISSISSVCHVSWYLSRTLRIPFTIRCQKGKKPNPDRKKKHNIIRDYIKRNYSDITTSTNLSESIIPHKTLDKRHNVWVFWYPGKRKHATCRETLL